MDDTSQPPPFDAEHLKQQIAEAIRTVVRERAYEPGTSPGEFINSLVKYEHGAAGPE